MVEEWDNSGTPSRGVWIARLISNANEFAPQITKSHRDGFRERLARGVDDYRVRHFEVAELAQI